MDRARLQRFIGQPLADLPVAEPIIVSPSDPVRRALTLMRDGSQSCVLAVTNGHLDGIFTERDVLTRCMSPDFDWDQPLESVMTKSPRTVPASRSIGEAVAVMQHQNYRTLPVVNDDGEVGLVRVGDLLTHFAEAFPEDVLNLPPRPHQVMERQEGG